MRSFRHETRSFTWSSIYLSPSGGWSPLSLSEATFPDHESQSSIYLLLSRTELDFFPPYNFPPPIPPNNTTRAEKNTLEKHGQYETVAAKMAQTSKNTNYRLDFRMCGKFSGKQGEQWLRKSEYDIHGLEGNIPISTDKTGRGSRCTKKRWGYKRGSMKVERERLVGWSWLWGLSAGVLSLFGACGLLLHLLAFLLSGLEPLGECSGPTAAPTSFYAIVARWRLSGLRQVPHLIINPLLSDKNLRAGKPYIFHTPYPLKRAKGSSCAMRMKGKLRVWRLYIFVKLSPARNMSDPSV